MNRRYFLQFLRDEASQPQAMGQYLEEAFRRWWWSKQTKYLAGFLTSTQHVIAPHYSCACGFQPRPFGTVAQGRRFGRGGESEGDEIPV